MSLESIDKGYIGQVLLDKGFSTWFRYLFRVIEETPFIVEELHKDLLQCFDDIYNQYVTRLNLNLPPRSAKTTLAKYFLVYCLTKNPKSNFIYTSYSQQLLGDICRSVINVLEHPVYKELYPLQTYNESEEVNPVDDFWKDYLFKETGKNTYSNRKIVTASGGVVLFASVGSQLTGFGAGTRGGKGFTGGLILDDANKPADIYSQKMRENVLRYYEETLLSRLNNSDALILNIQQRLHIEDLSGLLEQKYGFEKLAKPLIENDICQLPKQYTEERIKELQTNAYMFSAQYQQQPIILGGQVYKRDWWRFWHTNMVEYDYLFITSDTAMKVKQANDFSVICLWGFTKNRELYLLDMIRGKWEAPELERQFLTFWNKWRNGLNFGRIRAVYIEDKASGTGLIQSVKRQGNIPIKPIVPDKDKLQRAFDSVPYIEMGNVYLPMNENADISKQVIDECEAFTMDDTHLHDDIVDNVNYAIDIVYRKQPMRINPDVLIG